jgi:tRNA dimethylallyltransferase
MAAKSLIVIGGPTAVGKTALSIAVAKKFNCPVISADSRQFFKQMTIGTAKPSPDEIKDIPHYFINSHSITDEYNVGKFETDVILLLDNLFVTQDTVVMVGGSGLYIDAVCKGFDKLPEADIEVRNKINALLQSEGIAGLQNLLQQLDPLYYSKADIQNPQRLSRALEVCLLTGKPYSSLREEKIKKRNFNIVKIGLNTSRETLYNRINQRVDEMMQDGLLDEVKSLQTYKHLNALKTVGYKELFGFLNDETDLNTAVELIKQNTRRFAKRQITWFKRDPEMKWFEPNELETILLYLNEKINTK